MQRTTGSIHTSAISETSINVKSSLISKIPFETYFPSPFCYVGTHPQGCYCNRLKLKLSGIEPPPLVPLLAADLPPFPPPQASPAEKNKKNSKEEEKKDAESKQEAVKEKKQTKGSKEKKEAEAVSTSSPSPSPSSSVPGTPAEDAAGSTSATGRAARKKSREERRGPRDLEKEKEYAAMREKLYYMSKVCDFKEKSNRFLEFTKGLLFLLASS